MVVKRCVHCGAEGDDSKALPHKSTCRSTGKDETYVTVGKVEKPKPEPIVVHTESPTKTQTTKPKRSSN